MWLFCANFPQQQKTQKRQYFEAHMQLRSNRERQGARENSAVKTFQSITSAMVNAWSSVSAPGLDLVEIVLLV